MKHKRTITITIAVVALAILATFGIFRNTQPVKAQDIPPGPPDRISFGMVGITAGQTVRVNATSTSFAGCPCQRVVLTFRGPNGQLIRNRGGEVIRRSVELQPGDSTFLDVDYGELPPGPVRVQLRAVVVVIPPPITEFGQTPIPPGSIIPTVEVINNANGRSVFALFGSPVPCSTCNALNN